MTMPDPPEPDTLAAELAIGVLDGDERAAALRRVIADPAFAREVERWRDHFGSLFAGVNEVDAPADVFERTERQIVGRDTRSVVQRRSFNPWKPAALAASVAALAMAGLSLRPEPIAPTPTAPPPMVAAMALAEGGGSQPAYYDAAAGMVKMPGPMPIPEGRSAQLWAIDGTNPARPLGTFRQVAPGSFVAEARLGLVIPPGMKLAISIEPVGGSPTGQPTGPVIASGLLTKV